MHLSYCTFKKRNKHIEIDGTKDEIYIQKYNTNFTQKF